MWGFHERCSLIVTPRKIKFVTRSISVELIWSDMLFGNFLLWWWKCIYLVFLRLNDNLFTASQSWILDSSKFIVCISGLYEFNYILSVFSKLVSSAYKIDLNNVLTSGMFIYFNFFIISYLPRSTPSVRSTVLPGAPECHSRTCILGREVDPILTPVAHQWKLLILCTFDVMPFISTYCDLSVR